jgi:hypothetical protein
MENLGLLEKFSEIRHNRSVTTTTQSKLKKLYANLEPGKPLTAENLAGLGISADLAVHYVRSGWLNRLARGVYCRPNDSVALHPSLILLESKVAGLHVGGKSALEWYGVRQYLTQKETLHLYGWTAQRLPDWFVTLFPAEYHRKRLFEEQPDALLCVGAFEGRSNAPKVSQPERAFLEMLSEVGLRQTLQEAKEIAEGTYTLRGKVLGELLNHCTSVKTVRLCLQMGQELSLSWMSKLDATKLPTGSSRPWVSKSNNGLMVLKP